MRASHLFGTLEMPGQKAYPSKDIDYGMVNPSQGIFEVKQALVRKKTSTGRLWNEYKESLPVDKMDIYPKRDYSNEYPLSKATGSLITDAKASNPETITSHGYLPTYPEEEFIKGMLEKEIIPRADKAEARKFFGGIKMEKVKELPRDFKLAEKIKSKFDTTNIEKLKKLGFSDELISDAIKKEAEKDLAMVLEKPGMFQEAQIASAIQTAYENYVLSKVEKTGENAAGIGAGGDTQNPSVRAYAGAAQAAEFPAPVKSNTGIARLAKQLGEEERAEYLNPAAATVSNAALAGGGASIGTGPSGSSTFEERATAAIKKRGAPPGPRGPLSEEKRLSKKEKTLNTMLAKARKQDKGYESE